MRRALPLLCLITLFLAGCAIGRPQPVSRTGFAFDTVIQVTVYDPEAIRSGAAESALNDCMALASRYEALFSTTREDSDIYRLNHADGAAVRVDPETVLLLQTALSYADQTDDLFNPLIGALTSCWDFSATTDRHVPDAQRITEALLHVDPCCLTMDLSDQTAPVLCLSDPAARIDTGGIAKGYIADRMKETLVHQGINSALINLGGNVLAIGGRPDDAPFRIGIRQPFGTARETSDIISVNDRSVVTSGVYERYFEADGRRYHHIL
ncbi:MAG: FAD:protein FMN transferase, partial [Butyrivibrio sp.]|nr:FAD:protein FMN transferase [Butyrivibrio sp.]